MEVGRKIAWNMYKNPLNMNSSSVDNIVCAWHGDITNLARTKCDPDLAEQVLGRAAVLVSNWREYDDNDYKEIMEKCKVNECSMGLDGQFFGRNLGKGAEAADEDQSSNVEEEEIAKPDQMRK